MAKTFSQPCWIRKAYAQWIRQRPSLDMVFCFRGGSRAKSNSANRVVPTADLDHPRYSISATKRQMYYKQVDQIPISCRRDALDCGLSKWTLHFSGADERHPSSYSPLRHITIDVVRVKLVLVEIFAFSSTILSRLIEIAVSHYGETPIPQASKHEWV